MFIKVGVMAKKTQKHKHGGGFTEMVKGLEQEKQIKQEGEKTTREILAHIEIGEKPILSNETYNDILKKLSETKERQLGLNFMDITSNSKYNLQYFRDNKSSFDMFVQRLEVVLMKISQKQVKDIIADPIFGDKFDYGVLYKGVHDTNKNYAKDKKIISVRMGGGKGERIILCQDKPDDNILYVLAFDFNHDAYKHGN
jgi:hypothetical protein